LTTLRERSNFPCNCNNRSRGGSLRNGGSCIAGPDGKWILEPVADQEGILYYPLDFNRVLEERQNFDPVGHYSRPDVLQLKVNRERQSSVKVE
jgi:nitrilase